LQRRIIVIGASGVGKTTLVEALAPLLNLEVIPELGRKICDELGHSYIGDIPDQEGFKKLVLERQIAAEQEAGSFLADRSSIDCWVLWQRWNICQAMTYDTEAYYAQAREQSKHYTDIVYIPPMFAPADDGFRWTDLDYQKQVDRLVRMTLYEWNLLERTLTIQCSTHDKRVAEAMNWLNRNVIAQK
jgi:predicted ATPase